MMNLVTRILALADDWNPALVSWHDLASKSDIKEFYRQAVEVEPILREAADALKETTSKLNHESYCHDKAAQDRTKAERERDDFKAKLAEALDERLKDRYAIQMAVSDKAEARAEAAALREALITIRTVAEQVGLSQTWAIGFTKEALSQPGPGARYQERMRKLEAVVAASRRRLEVWSRETYADLQKAIADLDAAGG